MSTCSLEAPISGGQAEVTHLPVWGGLGANWVLQRGDGRDGGERSQKQGTLNLPWPVLRINSYFFFFSLKSKMK